MSPLTDEQEIDLIAVDRMHDARAAVAMVHRVAQVYSLKLVPKTPTPRELRARVDAQARRDFAAGIRVRPARWMGDL
jgi:hypothetical protein